MTLAVGEAIMRSGDVSKTYGSEAPVKGLTSELHAMDAKKGAPFAEAPTHEDSSHKAQTAEAVDHPLQGTVIDLAAWRSAIRSGVVPQSAAKPFSTTAYDQGGHAVTFGQFPVQGGVIDRLA